MVDKWTNPTNASLRGEDARPLQQTFASLSSYLDKLDTSIVAAAGAGVTSITAGSGISVSASVGSITVANTGVTSVAGTTNQITVSASTGAITVSLPSTVVIGGPFTSVNGGVDGGWSLRTWTASASYMSIATRDMAGSEYVLLSDGTNSFHSGGVGGTTYIRAGNNDLSGQVAVRASNIDLTGTVNSSGSINAYGYTGNANIGGTGSAAWFPNGLYSGTSGQAWIYGEKHFGYGNIEASGYHWSNGATGLTDANAISCSNWFRSTGGSGWYNATYTGGIYMEDSTWIRTYNSKNFYVNGSDIRSNGVFSTNNTNNGANLRMTSGNITWFGWFGYYAQYVDGTHVKTFVIDHPTKQDNYLVHACAEGPTSDVFYRGEAQLRNGICVVTLPDYFEALTELEGRSIMITPIADEHGPVANLAAHEIHDGQFVVEQIGGYHVPFQRFWWRVDAIRKNTEFEVEPSRTTNEIAGDGPYTYLKKKVA